MPGPSKVIVLDPDARSGRQIQLGFQREGVSAQIAPVSVDLAKLQLPTEDTGLVVVGGADGRAVDLVRRARALLEADHADVPIVFAGRGASRKDLEAAGADEVLGQPAYLRDVVTIGRLLVGQPAHHRTHLVGNLGDITGVLTLVRALSSLGRSAVLTLMRGLRRGEVRFFEGEVTSAQVGLIHGQAALHQLLLWTDARFDYHHEDIVRRQQIPLDHEELFADAERFLAGIRDESGSLSPAMVLEQDVARIQSLGKQIPTEVHGVLRMFDGHRVLADVLEDSPYRVFETLRVAQRAVDVGLLRKAQAPRPKATWRAVLAIEEWLVGAETKEDIVARGVVDNTVPVPKSETTGKTKKQSASRRQRKKRRPNTPLPVPPPITKGPDIDWGALVPRTLGAEVGPLSGVVPAAQLSGEIVLPASPSRDEPREKLEALMDTGKRERIFPTDIGLEPSIVLDDSADEAPTARAKKKTDASANTDAERAAAKADAERAAAALALAQAAKAAADAKAKAKAEADAKAAADAKAKAEADAKAKAEADVKAKADADAARAKADTEAKAKADADAKAKADADAKAKADADARAKADAEAKAKADADAKAKADADARAKADADARAKADADAKAKADADARAKADADAKAKADADAKAKTDADARAKADADAKAKADADAARANAEADAQAKPEAKATAETAADANDDAKPADAKVVVDIALGGGAPVDPARLREDAQQKVRDLVARHRKESEDIDAIARAGEKRLREETRDEAEAAAHAKAAALADAARVAVDAEAKARAEAEARAKADTTNGATASSDNGRSVASGEIRGKRPTSSSDLVRALIDEERGSGHREVETASTIVSETPTATVSVHDRLSVTTTEQTARLVATPETTVSEVPFLAKPVARPQARDVVDDAVTRPFVKPSAEPENIDDAPSDGIIRTHQTSEDETAPQSAAAFRRPPPGEIPVDDRPPQTTGEIRPRKSSTPPPIPSDAEPSILVADLQAAHTAASAAMSAAKPATPTINAATAAATPGTATAAASAEVSQVRRDATGAFTQIEEEFFRAGSHPEDEKAAKRVPSASDSFDDLDEGYERVGFWDRLLGRKKKP